MKEKIYIGIIIKQIHDALERMANRELKEKDLTVSQMRVLWALKNSESGSLTLKELEKLLRNSQPTTLGIAKRLEEKGFVKGEFDSSDKRIKFVKLAPKGEEVCQDSHVHMDETEEKFLKGLTKGERTLFTELLIKINKNIESYDF
ncbi:MAG: MarR family transcriptional regulator [Desulfatiglans sp.]|nr:MarR family transcriptional regulator [Desulfatiglans sp.]